MKQKTTDTHFANPLLSLGKFFSKVYSQRLALVFTPSLSTILKMMSALMGTYNELQIQIFLNRSNKGAHLTVAIFIKEEGDEALAGFLLSIGVDPHEPVCLPIFCPDAEHPRLQLLPILHVRLPCEVGDAPSMVIPGLMLLSLWSNYSILLCVRLIVCERPRCRNNGGLLDARGSRSLKEQMIIQIHFLYR